MALARADLIQTVPSSTITVPRPRSAVKHRPASPWACRAPSRPIIAREFELAWAGILTGSSRGVSKPASPAASWPRNQRSCSRSAVSASHGKVGRPGRGRPRAALEPGEEPSGRRGGPPRRRLDSQRVEEIAFLAPHTLVERCVPGPSSSGKAGTSGRGSTGPDHAGIVHEVGPQNDRFGRRAGGGQGLPCWNGGSTQSTDSPRQVRLTYVRQLLSRNEAASKACRHALPGKRRGAC